MVELKVISQASHWTPLRRSPVGEDRASLLQHHVTHHPQEEYLKLAFRDIAPDTLAAGYEFYGRFIEFGRVWKNGNPAFVGNLVNLPSKRLSEVAAKALEIYFGQADKEDHLFAVDWGMAENINRGKVFLDQQKDQIIAFSERDNITFSLKAQSKQHNPQGGNSNLVETVYLIEALEQIRALLQAGKIPMGVENVEITIVDREQLQAVDFAVAASPLKIYLSVPNLDNAQAADIRDSVAGALERALANISNATGNVIDFPRR